LGGCGCNPRCALYRGRPPQPWAPRQSFHTPPCASFCDPCCEPGAGARHMDGGGTMAPRGGPFLHFFELPVGWAGFLPWVFPCARAFAPQRKPARVSLQPSRGPQVVVPHARHPSPCASRRAQNARASPGAGRAPSGSLMSRPDCVPPFTGLKKRAGGPGLGRGGSSQAPLLTPWCPAATAGPFAGARSTTELAALF
jgi:hypothetical protein